MVIHGAAQLFIIYDNIVTIKLPALTTSLEIE